MLTMNTRGQTQGIKSKSCHQEKNLDAKTSQGQQSLRCLHSPYLPTPAIQHRYPTDVRY